jgi:hypothetical protein
VSSWTSPPPGQGEPARRQAPPTARPAEPAHGEHPHGEHHLHVPAGAHVADRRGLTATGAVTLALAFGFIGAAIDVNTGRGLRTTFAICFIVGSALAAMLVHREDIKATVVMPPLTYCVLALVGAALGHTKVAGSFVKGQALELVSALTLGAPVLYAATGGALLVALIRAFRSAQRP